MFEYVVAVSLGVLAFVALWDWIGDRLYAWALGQMLKDKEGKDGD